MTPAIAIIVALTVPHSDTAEYRCDVVEINHVFDMTRDPPVCHLSQVIFRNRGEILDWRILAKARRPAFDWQRGEWRTTWVEGGVTVEVKSAAMVETMTEFDAELLEREWLPECQRRRVNR